jgi:hypothetical protein
MLSQLQFSLMSQFMVSSVTANMSLSLYSTMVAIVTTSFNIQKPCLHSAFVYLV